MSRDFCFINNIMIIITKFIVKKKKRTYAFTSYNVYYFLYIYIICLIFESARNENSDPFKTACHKSSDTRRSRIMIVVSTHTLWYNLFHPSLCTCSDTVCLSFPGTCLSLPLTFYPGPAPSRSRDKVLCLLWGYQRCWV